MANSISGNCGLANASVYLSGFATGTTTADGSGNYSFTALAAGTYYVIPQVSGTTFTPTGSAQTIVSSNITGVNFTSASAPTQTPIWVKQGPIFGYALGGDNVLEPTVIYESGAVILSGTVYKMWYTDVTNGGVNYAESSTGLAGSWSQYSSNPVIHGYEGSSVFKHAGVYYYHGVTDYFGTPFDQWQSTDGVTWVKVHTAVLSPGTAGQWDYAEMWRLMPFYVDGNGTWWATYSGTPAETSPGHTGIVTSPDGHTWTKYANNPVLLNFSSAQVIQIGSSWYIWGDYIAFGESVSSDYAFPSQFNRAQSIGGSFYNWTVPVLSFGITQEWEGQNAPGNAGIDTLYPVVTPSGQIYGFYAASKDETAGTEVSMGLAIANLTLANIVQNAAETSVSHLGGTQLATDSFQRANENPLSDSGNWTTATTHAMQVSSDVAIGTSAGATSASAYTGITWPNDQYSEVTAGTGWAEGSGANYIIPIVRIGGTTASPTFYYVYVQNSGGNAYIGKYVSGTNTNLFSVSGLIVADGDVFRLTVVGTTLYFYQNDLLVHSLTDSSVSSGNAGFGAEAAVTNSLAPISLWTGGSAVNATPTFSPAAGTYTGSQSITISSASPGVNIYYTTDGSSPTSSSTLYTGPVTVSSSLTLKAIAILTGYTNSTIGSAAYTINTSSGGVPWFLDQNSQFDVVKRHKGF